MKNLISLILSVMLASSFFVVRAADSDITVKINGETIAVNQPPIIQNNRTLVPIRALSEAMKFDVDWDSSSQLVSISDMSKTLKLRIGGNVVNRSYKYRTDEENITIDVPAAIYNDYTYVPLRSVSELFGAEVEWEQETHTADIKYLNTYGKIIDFEDEGIEKLCRLEVTLGYPDTYYDISNESLMAIFNEKIPLYDGHFYEGMALQIKRLGIDCTTDFPEWIKIHSLNDMKYLPNVNYIQLRSPYLSDISGLKYNKTYDNIDLYSCPINDFDVLLNIEVKNHIQFGYDFGSHSFSNFFILHYNNDGFNLPVAETYPTFAKQVSELYHKLNSVYQNVISDDMSDYEKTKAIHDWIIEHTEYNYEAEADIGNASSNAHSYVGVFLDGKVVCQGYQEAFQFLCNMAGLECFCVSGTGNDKSHGWNIVKINNDYYHVDTTWDDGAGYTYFLKSDEFMKQDHSWETNIFDTDTGTYWQLPLCPKSYGE